VLLSLSLLLPPFSLASRDHPFLAQILDLYWREPKTLEDLAIVRAKISQQARTHRSGPGGGRLYDPYASQWPWNILSRFAEKGGFVHLEAPFSQDERKKPKGQPPWTAPLVC
jgi:hypothetical protein